MKKSFDLIVSFFTGLFNVIVSFFTGLINTAVGLVKGVADVIKQTVSAIFAKIRIPSVKGPATLLAVVLVYLSMGHLFPIQLKTKNIIGAPHGFVGRTLTGASLLTYSVNEKSLIRTAHNPFTNGTYIQVPLVGWVKVS